MMDGERGSNPHNPLPDDVVESLRRLDEQELAVAAQRDRVAALARPTEEERRLQAGNYETIAKSLGVDVAAQRAETAAHAERRHAQFQREDVQGSQTYVEIVPMAFEPAAPADTSFWAADWNTSHSAPFSSEGLADGIHFRGKKNSDSGSLQFYHYGVRSRYGLAPERIPPSATGRWRSAPHAELFGDLWAYTGAYDIFGGDSWSKCWMIRRQTLIQNLFGPTGPVPTKIGEAIDVQTIFNEENRHAHREHRMPGFQPMPPVILTHIFGGLAIWAELEIRFDIQLEGNAFHWIHPFDLLVRLFQWPLIPNA